MNYDLKNFLAVVYFCYRQIKYFYLILPSILQEFRAANLYRTFSIKLDNMISRLANYLKNCYWKNLTLSFNNCLILFFAYEE